LETTAVLPLAAAAFTPLETAFEAAEAAFATLVTTFDTAEHKPI